MTSKHPEIEEAVTKIVEEREGGGKSIRDNIIIHDAANVAGLIRQLSKVLTDHNLNVIDASTATSSMENVFYIGPDNPSIEEIISAVEDELGATADVDDLHIEVGAEDEEEFDLGALEPDEGEEETPPEEEPEEGE